GAFPQFYYTTGNIDFSTVKGTTIGFDLRKIGKSGISSQLNYTLQFADGTGSSSGDGLQYLQGGFENLRILIPLDFDRRHSISLNMDYRTDLSEDYKGWVLGGPKKDKEPKVKKKKKNDDGGTETKEVTAVVENEKADKKKGKGFQVFANSGVNVKIVGGSGMPYSKLTRPAQIGGTLKGAVNGARLPWSATFDVTFSREFEFTLGARKEDHTKGKKEGKMIYGYAYVEVFNIMNFKFVSDVNAFTGNPGDDGYLASAQADLEIANMISPDSFVDFYKIRQQSRDNYFSPRLIRLGVEFSF
ncbi:MAG: hypothetical protein IH948_01160, partial [Bacteroidetes bacterium]|nr:hypothetical protein [Bacteroidota bacterium]